MPQYEELMGKMAHVKIISTGKHYMMGEIIDVIHVPTNKELGTEGSVRITTSNKMLGLILLVTVILVLYRLPHIITVLQKLYI